MFYYKLIENQYLHLLHSSLPVNVIVLHIIFLHMAKKKKVVAKKRKTVVKKKTSGAVRKTVRKNKKK